MAEATCRRELELEVPAENVEKTTDKIARDLARVARVPGFRPGKAPVTLIRRRFAEEIKGEVLESLAPEYIQQALTQQKLNPITRPMVDQVNFTDAGPLKFRASFEILPDFDLGDYRNFKIEIEEIAVGDTEIDKTLEEMRQRAASFAPVEERGAQEDDYVQVKLMGTPAGGGEPVRADNVTVHMGSEETLAAFNENLRGAKPGDSPHFEMKYPDDYPDEKLKGKTYNFALEVKAIREKKLPELNDEFVKELGQSADGAKTLTELRGKIREKLNAARDEQQQAQARERILEELVKRHDFPVPQALIEHQMDVRLERVVRSLAAQGVDPRAVNVDWVSLRQRQHDRAERDVKAEILLDRMATAEKIEATDEDVEKEIASLAERSGESTAAIRARLTKDDTLDRIKSKLRSDKAVDWLYRTAQIQTIAKREK